MARVFLESGGVGPGNVDSISPTLERPIDSPESRMKMGRKVAYLCGVPVRHPQNRERVRVHNYAVICQWRIQ